MKQFLFIVPAMAVFAVLVACDRLEQENQTSSSGAETPDLNPSRSGPVEHIDAQERLEAALLVEATSPLEREQKVFRARIRGAFDDARFDELEKQARTLRDGRDLFSDGSWKLNHFYDAFAERMHTGDAGFMADLALLKKWEVAYPDSSTRRVALVGFLADYAWHARGSDYADSVTEEGWRLMGERLSYAWDTAQKLMQAEEKDPHGYRLAIRVAMGLNMEASVYNKILAESRKHYPDYYPTECARAYSLLPRWYGKDGEWEAFAAGAVKVKGGLGDETYARILMHLAGYFPNIIRDSKVTWRRAKPGLMILNEKYPDSLEIQNFTAYFAALGRDRKLAAATFDKLGDAYLKELWCKPERFVHFRTWARTGEW